MEYWFFKRIFAILILLSLPPVAGPIIQHCIILSEPQARTHYSGIPTFHHSNCERSEQSPLLTYSNLNGVMILAPACMALRESVIMTVAVEFSV